MNDITKGIWTANGTAIVTNIPHDRPGYSWEDKESEYNYYGGYIVAESIINSADAALICAAPNLLNVLQCIVDANEDEPMLPYHVYLLAKKAVLKARPGFRPTPYYVMPEIKKPMPLMLTGLSPNQHHSYHAARH